MKNNPKISIIIPAFNSSLYIRKTIRCCLMQDYDNLEVIVIDDGSTDYTVQILKEFENIEVIENHDNLGISKTVNIGVKASSGDWVLLLGHDDMLSANHVRLMSEHCSERVGLIHCNSLIIDRDDNILSFGRSFKKQINKTQNLLFELSIDNFIQSCGLIFRRDLFLRLGGWDEQYRLFGEWLMYIKFAQVSEFVFCNKTLGYYRKHPNNTIAMINRKKKRQIKNYKKQCRITARNAIVSSLSIMEILERRLRIAKQYISRQ